MTLDTGDLINSIMQSLGRISFIKPEDIPNIDLYMDQVTSFIDTRLKNTARFQDKDKILTKTMINNYAKNDLLPPPVKKKYNKEHVLLLIFIYYFKNVLSINDIQRLLNPLVDKYYGKDEDIDIASIYSGALNLGEDQIEALKKDVMDKYAQSKETFSDIENEDEKESLQLFSFLCMLILDVYVKKLLIEKIIDECV